MSNFRGGRSKKSGISLIVMVAGQSGLGRTTFVNTLCEQPVLKGLEVPAPQEAHLESPLVIQPTTVELEEDGVRIALTVVDTPGFGDNIDNTAWPTEILEYLERQYDEALAEESRIKRNPRFKDNRVHALIYFIAPTGHALRELDIVLMRTLAKRVNVIPVIGKSDSMTVSELREFKQRVMEDIEYYSIPVYNFPYDVEEDDPLTVSENQALRALLPFAIVGSNEELEINGELVRVRRLPWGVVEVDNPKHSDFGALRNALLSTHLTDLKEITHDYLYENYRTEKLSRSTNGRDSTILPDGLSSANGAAVAPRLKEEQLRREEEKLRESELKIAREIAERRQELLIKEETLRNLESRLAAQSLNSPSSHNLGGGGPGTEY